MKGVNSWILSVNEAAPPTQSGSRAARPQRDFSPAAHRTNEHLTPILSQPLDARNAEAMLTALQIQPAGAGHVHSHADAAVAHLGKWALGFSQVAGEKTLGKRHL